MLTGRRHAGALMVDMGSGLVCAGAAAGASHLLVALLAITTMVTALVAAMAITAGLMKALLELAASVLEISAIHEPRSSLSLEPSSCPSE